MIVTYRDFESIPFVINVIDVADTLKIGRNAAYSLINTGQIKAIKIGKQYRIPRDSFIAFLKGESNQE